MSNLIIPWSARRAVAFPHVHPRMRRTDAARRRGGTTIPAIRSWLARPPARFLNARNLWPSRVAPPHPAKFVQRRG
jgi:hypothetical protein